MVLVSFYQFRPLTGLPLLRARMEARGQELGVLGTILLAAEGVNGSVTGTPEAVDGLLADLTRRIGGGDWIMNRQTVQTPPFRRLKIRIRPEIIRFDTPDPDLAHRVGRHIPASEWNTLIDRPDVRLIDTRNDYEVALGSFEGADNPGTDTFRAFARWVDDNLDPDTDRHVAMFCTGGVRCEKASAWMKDRGFENVYQLEGGILSYLAEVDEAQSRWSGECFVFDDRVSVNHRLEATGRTLCQACRRPADGLDSDGLPPVTREPDQCDLCGLSLPADRRAGLIERARQIRLANERGMDHLGPQETG